jgi:gas vesicle protein
MAQTEDFVTRDSDLDAGRGRSSREIRSEIDRTRSDMDETFAALDAKLTPKEIGLELWSLFKGGSTTGASKLWQVAREHPMPAAVVGLGLGWLMVESSRKSDAYDGLDRGNYRGYGASSYRQGYAGTGSSGYADYEMDEDSGLLSTAKDKVHDVAGSAKDALSGAGDKVSDLAGQAKEQVSGLGHQVADKASNLGHQVTDRASDLRRQAKTQVRRARVGFWQTMEENPLMVGAATLALGVIVGLVLPSTDKEDELMGETRDQLLDEVKETGQQMLDKSKHVAEAVADKVKVEARNQGLTPEGVVDRVKNVAKEATNTAKEEAKRQNLTPEALTNQGQQGQQAQPQGQQSQPAPQGQGQPQAKPAQPSQQATGQPEAQGSKTPSAKPEVHEPELAKR